MSSLLYLYSRTQEAVRQSDRLFNILRHNSVLRVVNDLGMSTFDANHILYQFCPLFATYFRSSKNYEPFYFEASVKVSRICNLGPFSLQRNRAYFHIKHTYLNTLNTLRHYPRLLFKYLHKGSNKVLKVFLFYFLHSSSAGVVPEQRPFSVAWRCLCLANGEIHNCFQICPFSGQM